MENRVIEYLKENRDRHLEELKQFLSIPSISSLSEHHDDIVKAAEWVKDELVKIGIEKVEIMETGGKPVVYGELISNESAPTVLIYGHYDVQPVDPIALWESDPFEPVIRDNKIYARGSTDDKGQVFMHLKVVEAILKTNENKAPINFKFLIEGEEEIGSPTLPEFARKNAHMLEADLIVVSDSALVERGKPTITYGLRGLAGIQLMLKAQIVTCIRVNMVVEL